MNPLFLMVMATFLGLKTNCPKCLRDQVVRSSKKGVSVNCEFCGEEIPPRKYSAKI